MWKDHMWTNCIGLYSRTDGEVLFKGKDPQKLTGKEKQNYKKSVQMVSRIRMALLIRV